jgi:hypothetical protein
MSINRKPESLNVHVRNNSKTMTGTKSSTLGGGNLTPSIGNVNKARSFDGSLRNSKTEDKEFKDNIKGDTNVNITRGNRIARGIGSSIPFGRNINFMKDNNPFGGNNRTFFDKMKSNKHDTNNKILKESIEIGDGTKHNNGVIRKYEEIRNSVREKLETRMKNNQKIRGADVDSAKSLKDNRVIPIGQKFLLNKHGHNNRG